MANNIFQEIIRKAQRQNVDSTTKDSRKWFRSQVKSMAKTPTKDFLTDKKRYRQSVTPGMMYMFYYDPKHKKTLPYYDTFPMIFPIHFAADHFLGINLHYLPYDLRARLMDALSDLETKGYKGQRKLKISYEILKSASKYKAFKPCIKKYLKSHVRSRFFKIEPEEWNLAIMLPLERFEKASKTKVWKDSREMMRG